MLASFVTTQQLKKVFGEEEAKRMKEELASLSEDELLAIWQEGGSDE
jgi:hypothetical protein